MNHSKKSANKIENTHKYTLKKESKMRSKAVIVFVTLLAVTLLAGSAFAQIQWNPNRAATLSVDLPGKPTTATLRMYIDPTAELTNDQWLKIHIGDFFVVSSTEAENAGNYSFASASGSLNMDNDGSDFAVTYSEADSILTITLDEYALIPGDSLYIVISNVLINKGDNGSSSDAFHFKVRSTDQPLWSTDTDSDNDLQAASDQRMSSITFGDSVASNQTYVTIIDTAEGYIPKTGKLQVILPDGYTYTSSSPDSIFITDDGNDVTLDYANITASGRTITIPFNNSTYIADGSVLVIKLGNSGNKIVNNATIYTGTSPDVDQSRTYTTGTRPDFALTNAANKYHITVYGLDYDDEEIFFDQSQAYSAHGINDLTYDLVSNWFPASTANSGWGGTLVGDNTAGSLTPLNVWFMTSTRLDTLGTTGGGASLPWIQFDFSDFDIILSEVATAANYTFTGGGFSTGKFTVDTTGVGSNGTVTFLPAAGTDGYIPEATQIKLVVASGVLQNKAEASDFTVSFSTSRQTTTVDDRDTDAILPNTGGIITRLQLADSAAGQPSAIDTLVFTTPGWIPADGKIKITLPSQFTLTTSLDSATIKYDSAGGAWGGGTTYRYITLGNSEINTLSTAAGTITNTEIILELNSAKRIPAGSTVGITIGDTVGYHARDARYNPAFNNPAPAYAGTYPTTGTYSPITITVTDANDGQLLFGNNNTAPVGINTIRLGTLGRVIEGGGAISPQDSIAHFRFNTTHYDLSTISAGDTASLRIWFTVGDSMWDGDTLFFDVGNFFDVDNSEANTAQMVLAGGGYDDFAGVNYTTGYDATKKAAYIVLAGNDVLCADSLMSLTFPSVGADARRAGGMLYARGERNNDILLSIWSSRQHTPVTMTSTNLAFQVAAKDTVYHKLIAKTDSVAGETSTDSLKLAWADGSVFPGGYISVKLDTGMSFITPAQGWDGTKISVTRTHVALSAPLTPSVTRVADDSITIAFPSDTLMNGRTQADTLLILVGDGTTNLINNFAPSYITGRRDSVVLNDEPYKVKIFDSDGRLVKDFANGGIVNGTGATVTNVFTGGPLSTSTAVTGTTADTTGMLIDSLFIPFQVGEKIYSGRTLTLTFHGAIYTNQSTAETEANYVFLGDTGIATRSGFIVAASSDSVLTFTFSAGTLGTGNAATPFQDTLVVLGVMNYLGFDGSDGLKINLKSSVQTNPVTDNTTITLAKGDLRTMNLNLGAWTEGLDDTDPGAAAVSWAGGYGDGTGTGYFHGTVFKDGIIRLKFPIEQDSTTTHGTNGTGVYAYSFPGYIDPDNSVLMDNTFATSGNAGTSSFKVIGCVSGAIMDTMTISWVTYDELVNPAGIDTAVFSIKLDGTSNTNNLTSHDTLIVEFNNKITNPTEATSNSVAAGVLGDFAYNELATSSMYKVQMDIIDRRGYVLSNGRSPNSWNDIDAVGDGNETQFLLVMNGQKHDPGGMATGGTYGYPDSLWATTDSTLFLVAAVDDYYNIIDVTTDPAYINLAVYSGADQDNNNEVHIGNDNLASAGVLTIPAAGGGLVQYAASDSFRIHKAGDGRSDLGRNFHKTIEASLAQVRGTTITTRSSDPFKVKQGTYKRLAVIMPGEALLEGDTTNVKTGSSSLSGGGTYNVTVYPTDIYYNRSDTIHTGSPTGHLTVAATNATPNVSSDGFESSGTNKYSAVFQIKADQGTGAGTVTVTETAVTLTAAGTGSFTVISATIQAVFAALEDTTEPAGASHSFSVDLRYSGTFPTDSAFTVWLHSEPDHSEMDEETYGGTKVLEDIHTGEGSATLVTYNGTMNLRTIPEGKWYMYITAPSISNDVINTSDTTWFRIFHEPVVDTTTTPLTPTTTGTVLNSGSTPATTTQTLNFKVVDYDDGTVPVWMFVNTRSDGVAEDFDYATETFTINAGEGTEKASYRISGAIGSELALDKYDNSYLLDILDPQDPALVALEYIPAGDYYLYVVTRDPSGDVNTARSAEYMTIKHSPTITLDKPVLGTTNINTATTRSVTIGWTSGGDGDRDDDATIKILVDSSTKNYPNTSVGVNDLLNSATSVDVTGSITIKEDDPKEGGTDLDLFTWDLRSKALADLPVEGVDYDVYALIYDARDTILSVSPGAVRFTHDPRVDFSFNFGNPISKSSGLYKANVVSQVTVNNGEILRMAYDASDLDQDQYLRFVISQRDTVGVNYQSFTFGTDGWIMNSTNGLESGAIDVTTDDDFFNWFSEDMSGLTGSTKNGDYYIYAFITKDGTKVNWINSNVKKFVARGKVKLAGREATVTDWDLRISPSLVSVTEGDTVECTLLLDSQGEELEIFAAYVDIDTTLFDVVDLASPFADSGSQYFFGLQDAMENSGTSTGGYHLLNLVKQKTSGGTAADTAIATFKLVARSNATSGTTTGSIYFGTGSRNSESQHGGTPKGLSVPSPALRVLNNPPATILGLVPLEKRTNHSKVITLELRRLGEEVPYMPTEFVTANDEDLTTSGIQVTTANDGQYTLTNVPTGKYYLVANTDSYIAGKYPLIDVVPGDALQGIHPTYNNDADPIDYGELKGGDVSSTISTGEGDNLINTADISFITGNWGENVATTPSVAIGDINGDGVIEFDDFSIASANQGLKGIPPRYNKVSISNEDTKIKLEGVPEIVQEGEEFTVEVWAHNVADLFAYVYQVRFDPEKLEFVGDGAEEGDMLTSRPGDSQTFFFMIEQDMGTLVGSALEGRTGDYVSGNGVIARMTFRALSGEETPNIQLHNVRLANSNADVDRLGDVAMLPDEFGLADNYPNPFNPVTRIRFQLPKAAHVTMKVYNILGQEVRTLVNKDMSAGFHFIRWDGTNSLGKRVSSGVYIYRIQAGDFKMSKKMTLIK